MEDNQFHKPVLLGEVLEYLDVREGKRYVDATVGGGGHSAAIIEGGGVVLGIDQDPKALESAQNRLRKITNYPTSPRLRRAGGSPVTNYELVQGNFRQIDKIAQEHGFTDPAGILFDLGMSSYQLDASRRGFSFRKNESLDLRMDSSLKVTAADLVNGLTQSELAELFRTYGEEPKARKIAEEITQRRATRKITTTQDLRRIVKSVGGSGKTMARVWQALRIAVNDEINSLQEALPKAIKLLKPGGRIVVISFHSLEDRVVKEGFREEAVGNSLRVLTQKPMRARGEEIAKNPRAKSAKLRVGERL